MRLMQCCRAWGVKLVEILFGLALSFRLLNIRKNDTTEL
jgi:hypothetical protein